MEKCLNCSTVGAQSQHKTSPNWTIDTSRQPLRRLHKGRMGITFDGPVRNSCNNNKLSCFCSGQWLWSSKRVKDSGESLTHTTHGLLWDWLSGETERRRTMVKGVEIMEMFCLFHRKVSKGSTLCCIELGRFPHVKSSQQMFYRIRLLP